MLKRLIAAALAAACLMFALIAPSAAQQTKPGLIASIASCFPDNTAGSITPAITRGCLDTMVASFQQYTGVNAQTGTSYTIASTDYGQLLTCNNINPVGILLPQAIGSFSPFNIYVTNLGTGTCTITPQVSTINGASSYSLNTGASVWIVSDGSNYQVWGTNSNASALTTGTLNTARLPAPYTNGTALNGGSSGNNFATTTGSFTSGHCVQFTGGNLTDAGTACAGAAIDNTLQANGKSLWYNTVGTNLRYFYASPIGPTLDLRDCMDAHYGVGGWVPYSGVGTGTDIGPALQACYSTLATAYGDGTAGHGTIVLPVGQFALKTSGIDLSGVCLVGAGGNSQSTVIVYELTVNAALIWSGKDNYTGGCARHFSLELDSGHGATSAVPLELVGNCPSGTSLTPPCWEPDQWQSDDLYISAVGGSSYWANGPLIDGEARQTPQGVRVGTINNWQIFQCVNYSLFLKNVVQWTLSNLGTYTGFTSAGMDVYVSGAGTSLTNSTQVTATGLVVGNSIQLNNSSNVWLSGLEQNIIGASTATFVSATLQNGGNLSSSSPVGVGSNIHVMNHDAPGTISSCGTSPSAATGGDYDGQVTEGTTSTGCTISFIKPWFTTPRCTVSEQQGSFQMPISSIGTTQLSWTHTSTSNAVATWHCTGF